MHPILSRINSPFQNAFLQHRRFSNNTIVVHELFNPLEKIRKHLGCAGLKLILAKAFNRLEWPFIQYVLCSHNFPDQCIKWIMTCIKTEQTPPLGNGIPQPLFTPKRGVRQRDPLSPYPFHLKLDALV